MGSRILPLKLEGFCFTPKYSMIQPTYNFEFIFYIKILWIRNLRSKLFSNSRLFHCKLNTSVNFIYKLNFCNIFVRTPEKVWCVKVKVSIFISEIKHECVILALCRRFLPASVVFLSDSDPQKSFLSDVFFGKQHIWPLFHWAEPCSVIWKYTSWFWNILK